VIRNLKATLVNGSGDWVDYSHEKLILMTGKLDFVMKLITMAAAGITTYVYLSLNQPELKVAILGLLAIVFNFIVAGLIRKEFLASNEFLSSKNIKKKTDLCIRDFLFLRIKGGIQVFTGTVIYVAISFVMGMFLKSDDLPGDSLIFAVCIVYLWFVTISALNINRLVNMLRKNSIEVQLSIK